MKHVISDKFHQLTNKLIPGGVNSPFRSFHEVGGKAIFMKSGLGAIIKDVDDNEYIDYVGAWGPLILGHRPQTIIMALNDITDKVMVTGAPHELEYELAFQLNKLMPSLEKIRFVNSGTESCMSAIRLARGYTKRDYVMMFEGGYHGHLDITLVSENHQSSTGIPDNVKVNTVMAKYNDIDSVELLFKKHANKIACVIIEPVAGSMSVIEANHEFLHKLRQICTQQKAILIFDEVLTGFRVALGGSQSLSGVKPDLTCLGKILGGGMPIGAYGGKAQIMDNLMPLGLVYQAGTFSGNPLSMACGKAVLNALSEDGVYEYLEDMTHIFASNLTQFCQSKNYPVHIQRVGSMFSIIFSANPVLNYADSLMIDTTKFAQFFHYLLDRGIYLPPSAVDAACISKAHKLEHIEKTLEVCYKALSNIYNLSTS